MWIGISNSYSSHGPSVRREGNRLELNQEEQGERMDVHPCICICSVESESELKDRDQE